MNRFDLDEIHGEPEETDFLTVLLMVSIFLVIGLLIIKNIF